MNASAAPPDDPLPELEQIIEIRDPAVDVEKVMAEIRATLRAHGPLQPPALQADVLPSADPGALAFHIAQANLSHDQVWVELNVLAPRVPLIGGLLARARQMAHELVVYYVNKHAGLQVQFNASVVQALSALAARTNEVEALRAELAELKAKLAREESSE